MVKVNIPDMRSIYEIMKKEGDTHCNPLEQSMLARSHDLVLKKIRIEQYDRFCGLHCPSGLAGIKISNYRSSSSDFFAKDNAQ